MSDLVCTWCGVGNPAGSAECGACGASLKPPSAAQSKPAEPAEPPEPDVPEPEAPAPEPVVEPTVRAQVASATPAATPPPSPATIQAKPAASGGPPSIADLRPCPNKECAGVVAPGDAFCTFCGTTLEPPKPPPVTDAPAGVGEPPRILPDEPETKKDGGFHIPRGVWVVLAILPLVTCALIATLVLTAIAGPLGGLFGPVKPEELPEVQKDAERIAWPSGTPTRAPTATRTAAPSATPTATATPAAGAKSPVPTTSSHATYTPVVPDLPAGVSTVSVADNAYTGVKVYARNTRQYMFQIVGRAADCPVDPYYYKTNAAFQVRRPNGRLEWIPESQMLDTGARDNWAVPADDPALKAKQLTALTGCK